MVFGLGNACEMADTSFVGKAQEWFLDNGILCRVSSTLVLKKEGIATLKRHSAQRFSENQTILIINITKKYL